MKRCVIMVPGMVGACVAVFVGCRFSFEIKNVKCKIHACVQAEVEVV